MIIDSVTTNKVGDLSKADEIKLRNAAIEFESLLLTQLTSVLARSSDKNSLFGTDAGTDLARKMFSEQLATAMAKAGGVGIADTFLKSVGFDPKKVQSTNFKPTDSENKVELVKTLDRQETKLETRKSPADLVFEILKESPVKDKGGIGIVSVDQDTADDKTWRAPFVDSSQGIDVTKKENQLPTDVPGLPGKYQMPVEGRISSKFGMRFHPIDRRQKFHSGMDIAAPTGTPIKAAFDGEVIFAGRRGGYGNFVELKHPDGRTTRYAHANSLNVKVGDQVKAGEKIATVGATGKTTGPHLHFEIRENGKAVNPSTVIN